MVEMKSSYLDSTSSMSLDEHAPLVHADPLLLTPPSPSAPPSYQDASVFVHVQGEAIPPLVVDDVDDNSNSNNNGASSTAPTIDPEDDDEDRATVTAAGWGAGILGFCAGGPVLAVLLGFGGAYAAEHRRGQFAGDAARAIGRVARVARAQAVALDARHRVVDRSRVAARDAWRRAQQVDREHRVLDRARDATVHSWKATLAYVQEHNLVERGVNTIGSGLCWVIEKVTPSSSSGDDAAAVSDHHQQQNNRNLAAATTGVRPMPPPASRS